MNRNKRGQFVRKATAAKIRELDESGLSKVAIAKKLNVRYQQVFRTLDRELNGNPNRRRVATDRPLPQASVETCNQPLCLASTNEMCECKCQGLFHGLDHVAA